MKLLNKLLNIVEYTDINEQKEQVDQSSEVKIIANINFLLCSNGSLQLECNWLDTNDQMTKLYSKLLYYVCFDNAEKLILQQLLMDSEKDIAKSHFIESVLREFIKIKDTKNKKECNPMILPSQALKIHNVNKDEDYSER